MTAKATALLQKGRDLPEAGRWNGIAAVGFAAARISGRPVRQAFADYQQSKDQVPEEVRPEMMLLAANSQRQLGHMKEAQDDLSADHAKISRAAKKRKTLAINA